MTIPYHHAEFSLRKGVSCELPNALVFDLDPSIHENSRLRFPEWFRQIPFRRYPPPIGLLFRPRFRLRFHRPLQLSLFARAGRVAQVALAHGHPEVRLLDPALYLLS